MLCDERERLLGEYRAAVEDATVAALRVVAWELNGGDFSYMQQRIQDSIAAGAKAGVDLREHMGWHRCGTHSAWSSLLLWHSPPTQTTVQNGLAGSVQSQTAGA
ncbi:MAG: hypothetical protein ABSB35_17805 [Bryobacteraceae bacterium]|jgi:hypothetical protein